MDFEINDEQRLLADSVGRWLDADYRFEDFRRFASDALVARQNWARLAELGLLGVNIPEKDGGLGGGPIETLLIMQQFGRALVVDPYVSNAVIAVALVAAEPAGERRARLLEQIGAGSCRVSIAALEPDGRFDLSLVRTVAKAEGDGFSLSGRKAVVIHGDTADQLIVSGRTAGGAGETHGISLFLVDAHSPGIDIRGFPTIDGQRAAYQALHDLAHEVCEGKWIATGGYEFTAGKVFSRSDNFDVFLLEYDDERSGSFEPLAEVPDDKVVVLGLVSSKLPGIEPADELIARIDEAARYIGKERLALSTQCGFSPVSIGGNLISEETQQRKLELVAEVAHRVW